MTRRPHRTQLRAEGEAAIAGAPAHRRARGGCASRFLGRKAELPNLLRGVAQLPPEERGAVGKAANEARRALEARGRGAPGRARARRARRAPGRRPRRRHAARHARRSRSAACTCSPQTRREIEDVFLGLGFRVVEGPEVETVYYNFDALNHDADAPGAAGVGHVLRRRRHRAAHAHLADADPRDGGPAAAALHRHPRAHATGATTTRTHTPQFHQVEGLAVDEDITLADLKGTLLAFARAIFGDEREVRLRPHFFPFTEPSVEVDVSCFNCDDGLPARRLALPAVQGRGLDRDPRRRRGRPERLRVRARVRLRPRAPSRASPSAWGSSGSRCSSTASPTCGCSTTTTCASWSSSADAAPRPLAQRLLRPGARPRATLEERLTMTGTKVERVYAHGVDRARELRRRPGADAPSATRTPTA